MREKVVTVIEMVAEGALLKKSLEEQGLRPVEFFRALRTDTQLEMDYDSAQLSRAELLVEELVDIADTEADPIRARVRIDARKWYASKMRPSKYGERIDLNITQVVDIRAAIADARKRVIDIVVPVPEIDIFT